MNAGADRPQERPDAAPALELRITTGVHAGARIALQAPDDSAASPSVSIGPGLDHDVVLSDAPGSAQLRHEGGLWRWVERDFTAELESGGGWRWGGLQLTLSPPGAAWDPPSRLLFDRSNPQPASATGDAATPEPARVAAASTEAEASERDSASVSASEETPAEPARGDAQPAQSGPPTDAAASARAGRRRWVALAAGLALLAIFVGVILSAGGGSKPPAPLVTASTPSATPDQPAKVDLKALQQALEQAGLANRVRVSSLADGRVRLTGVVLDDDEIDRMISSVRKVTPRIVQGVLTQPEFVRRVAELQTEIPQPVRMRAVPVGRLLLIDAEREGIDLPALRDWLARNLPEALEVRAIERARLAEVEAPPPSPGQTEETTVPAPAAPLPQYQRRLQQRSSSSQRFRRTNHRSPRCPTSGS